MDMKTLLDSNAYSAFMRGNVETEYIRIQHRPRVTISKRLTSVT